jgi:hypothetical protein
MYRLPTSNHLRRNLQANKLREWQPVYADPEAHRKRIMNELKTLGVSKFGLMSSESQYLPRIIKYDEPLTAVVYGKYESSFAMLIATERRIVFLDKKPFFTDQDDIDYAVVAGVGCGNGTFASTVTLHTRIKTYAVTTMNWRCARGFVRYIQQRIEHNDPRREQYWKRINGGRNKTTR